MNRQVEIKCEQIARMIVKGLPKTRIAIEMGMSYDGMMRITRDPEYLKIEEGIRKGVTDQMDKRLAKRAEMSGEVEDAVPEALQVLMERLKKRDLKAALEVLDRDPRRQFSKARGGETVNPLQPGAPVLAADQLTRAVHDADITHQMLEKQANAVLTKPAEA